MMVIEDRTPSLFQIHVGDFIRLPSFMAGGLSLSEDTTHSFVLIFWF